MLDLPSFPAGDECLTRKNILPFPADLFVAAHVFFVGYFCREMATRAKAGENGERRYRKTLRIQGVRQAYNVWLPKKTVFLTEINSTDFGVSSKPHSEIQFLLGHENKGVPMSLHENNGDRQTTFVGHIDGSVLI